MARVKGAMMTRKRRKKILKLAKGYFGSKSRHFKMAKQAVYKSGNYAYIGRKQKNVTSEDCGSPEFLLLAVQTTPTTLYSSMA